MRQGATLCAAFSAAVFVGVYLLPGGLWLWLGLAALLPAGWCLWRKRRRGVLVSLGVAAALLWCAAYQLTLFSPGEALHGRRTLVCVTPSELPAPGDYGGFSLPCYILNEGALPIPAVAYGQGLEDARPGDELTFLADCTCRTYLDQGEISSPASRGIFVTLQVRGEVNNDPARRLPWWSLPRYWGQQLAMRVADAFPDDVSGFLAAMTAGDRRGVSDSDYAALSRAGIVHLLAVSGMHVSFLVGLLTLVTGASPRRRAAVCLPVVAVFALAVGGSPSVLRAAVIWAFALLAPALGREEDPWSALAAALALLLLLNPLSAANVGLQLSFAAVAGITSVTPRLAVRLRRLRLKPPEDAPGWKRLLFGGVDRLLRAVWAALAATLGALAFTVPIIAWRFGTLSLAAPLTNVLVIPVAAVVFALGLVTGLVGFAAPAAAAAMGSLFAWPARYVLAVARAVAAFPYSAVTLSNVYYPAALLGVYALALMAALWKKERRRWWVFAVCAGVMLGAGVLFTHLTLQVGDLTVTVLSVGQGQCVLLRSAGETAMIDCGGNCAGDPGDVAADYLLERGVTRLDRLILTHYHDDHVSGLATVFDRLDVEEVVMPQMAHDPDVQTWILELAAEENAAVTWVKEDCAAPLGGAQLQIFAPLGSGEANEEGLSVLAGAGDFHALITGDMGVTVEERLVKYHDLPLCEVLVAGHHGSAGSNGDVLLGAIRPRTALISVGDNSYGHPSEETLDRLRAQGADVYRTDLSGHLTATAINGKGG